MIGVVAMIFITSRQWLRFYYDVTYTKENTLSEESQEIMAKLNGKLKITTYVNIIDKDYHIGIPKAHNSDFKRFDKYMRFKSDIELDYLDYYGSTKNQSLYDRYPNMSDEEIVKVLCNISNLDETMFLPIDSIPKQIDLESEDNRFIRVLGSENGQRELLRLYDDDDKHPSESEISGTLKRFVTKAPIVAFLVGHDERQHDVKGEKNYSSFTGDKWSREALQNQGLSVIKLDLSQGQIPDFISILVIADPKIALTKNELSIIEQYITKGGNLFVLADYCKGDVVNPIISSLGVTLSSGLVVQPSDYFGSVQNLV